MALSVDDRAGPAVVFRLVVEAADAEDVVDVVVREDRGAQGRVGPPGADAVEQALGVAGGAGVQHDEAIAGVECVHRGGGLDVEEAVVQFFGLAVVPGGCHGVRLVDDVDFAPPEAIAELSKVRHRFAPYPDPPVPAVAQGTQATVVRYD